MSKYSELIYLYLDGEATPEEQQELFEALSQSEELQREFQQALQMYRAIEAERLVTVAPPELKSMIYAAIGIKPVQPLAHRLALYVGTSAAAVGLVIGLTLWFRPTPSPDLPPISRVAPQGGNRSIVAAGLSQRQAPIHPVTAGVSSIPTPPDTPPNAMSPVAESFVTDNEMPFTLERPTATVTSAEPFLRTAYWRIGMISAPARQTPVSTIPPITTHFTYRGSLLATSGPAASTQNFSIAAFYRFDDNNRLGLEFRRAPYTLNIAQPTGTFSTVLLSSLAVSYMFTEPDVRLLGGMPFVQPSVGLSSMGPLATLSAGLSFPISSAFNFNVGFDGSALVYSSQVASTLSVTIGFSLGVPIR